MVQGIDFPADFRGAGRRMAANDIANAAELLACEPAAVRAILAVETIGSGFDAQGRPCMLFEPHVFYRLLGPGDTRDAAVQAGLAYENWGEQPYPADSYPRLHSACALDRDNALMAASWGIGQVLGENWLAAGSGNVEAMVRQEMDSEAMQLMHMVRFIRARGLARALQQRNWVAFALGYNGRAEARHQYDAHLAQAFDRLKGIPAAPGTPAIPVPAAGREMTADELNALWLKEHPAA